MPATLPIGTVVESGDIAELNAQRFNRHTFWCGQSGSGKTYALGVVLEQMLAHTSLPLVILDPNADFVRLGEVRPEAASTGTAAALAGRDIRVITPRPSACGGSSSETTSQSRETSSSRALYGLARVRHAAPR